VNIEIEQDIAAATRAEIFARDQMKSLADYARQARIRASSCIDRGDHDGARAAMLDAHQADHETLKYRAAVLHWSADRRKARPR